MRITVFCSDPQHHVWPALKRWCEANDATLAGSLDELSGGDLLILVSCTHVVPKIRRDLYRKALVIHESDLPEGRGWSPLAWQILEGRNEFTVSLIECSDPVDSGDVWAKRKLVLEGHELSDEINDARDAVRVGLMDFAVENFYSVRPKPQEGKTSHYRRRTPQDSQIDPLRSIAEQFDLLRICEQRFPAFFWLRGHRYEIALRKTT